MANQQQRMSQNQSRKMKTQNSSYRSQSRDRDNSEREERSEGREERALTGAFLDSKLGAALNEKAPELIQSVVQYLDDNWGLTKIEKVASLVGIGETIDLRRITEMADLEGIKRRITARPVQTAAFVAAAVGLVILGRQIINETDLFSQKSNGRARH